MAFLNACGASRPEFTCSAPWQHKKISQFDNSLYTMLVINAHQLYPTSYQVGVLEVVFIAITKTSSRSSNIAFMDRSYQGRRTIPHSRGSSDGRMTHSQNVTRMTNSGPTTIEHPKNSTWQTSSSWGILSFILWWWWGCMIGTGLILVFTNPPKPSTTRLLSPLGWYLRSWISKPRYLNFRFICGWI